MSTSPHVIPFWFETQSVRVVSRDGEPWFVAKDVCDVLGIRNCRDAVSRLDDDEGCPVKVDTLGGEQELSCISESGLYTMIIRSNKPQAKPFRRWVTKEVLPTIRKTGSYTLTENDKRVFVNFNHKREGVPPHGLDIRYTMDLSKIITRPNRTTIELLERLTGIELADVMPEADELSTAEQLIADFITACCTVNPGERLLLKDFHAAFCTWHKESVFEQRPIITNKRASSIIRGFGHQVTIVGGLSWIYGLKLNGEVQV